MRFKSEYLHCDPMRWAQTREIKEVGECVTGILWDPHISKQEYYNEKFRSAFLEREWKSSPALFEKSEGTLLAPNIDLDYCFQNPPTYNLKGDFRKDGVFVEVEFGNQASVFRDYFKFLCGAAFQIFDLGVLVTAVDPPHFLPAVPRPKISSMSSFDYAYGHLRVLPMPVPMLLIGLLPEN